MSRKLLVATNVMFDRNQNIYASGTAPELYRQHLRRWLLFWDSIAVVQDRGSRVSDLDLEFLLSTGFAEYFTTQHPGGDVATIVHDNHLTALYSLEDKEPGTWAVDLSEGSLFCPNHNFLSADDILHRRGVLVELTNVIPVPDREAPLAEILEFKERRNSEMLALRHEVEDLYQDVSEAPDPALAINTGREKLVQASNDAVRVYRESALPFRMSSEIATFNILGAIAGGAPSILAQAPLQTTLSNAAMGAVTIGLGVSWKRRKWNGTPFEYVAMYHNEVFGE